MAINEGKLNNLMGQFVHDFGAALHAVTIVVGDQLGRYKALAEGLATAEELATRSQTDLRYLREWLSAQAASAYVCYEPESKRFFSAGRTFPPLPSSARPLHARRRWGCVWVPRQRRAVSPVSGVPPRHRST